MLPRSSFTESRALHIAGVKNVDWQEEPISFYFLYCYCVCDVCTGVPLLVCVEVRGQFSGISSLLIFLPLPLVCGNRQWMPPHLGYTVLGTEPRLPARKASTLPPELHLQPLPLV